MSVPSSELGPPHPLSRKRVWPPPKPNGGGHTRLRVCHPPETKLGGGGGGAHLPAGEGRGEGAGANSFNDVYLQFRIAGDTCLRAGHVDPAEGGAEDSLRLLPPHGGNIPPLHHPRTTR
jgi:hypothetical protein